jgi:hypothetical protein
MCGAWEARIELAVVIKKAGIRIYYVLNSLVTIVIKRVSRWHQLKCYTDVGAVHHSIRLSRERK